jgi:hypothetical protein
MTPKRIACATYVIVSVFCVLIGRGIRVADIPDSRTPRLSAVPGALIPDFPDASDVSAWRLRLSPEKPSVSDQFLPK